MLRSLDCHRYTGNMVEPNIAKPGSVCSIQFTQTFAGKQTRVDRRIGNILKPTILKSEFHSILIFFLYNISSAQLKISV